MYGMQDIPGRDAPAFFESRFESLNPNLNT